MSAIQTMLVSGVGVCLWLTGTAGADVVRESRQVHGDTASATWRWSDGCQFTSVNLWGAEQVTRTTGGEPDETRQVGVELTRNNPCTGDFLSVWGETTAGVDISGTTAATIDAEITVIGEHCGRFDGVFGCQETEPETVSVTATFSGIGDVTTGRTVQSRRTGSSHTTYRYSGQQRDASVTGSLVFDGAELLIGDPYALLQTVTDGTQSITRY